MGDITNYAEGIQDNIMQEHVTSARITCRKVSTMEDFRLWIEVVNTALHGWEI